MLTLLKNAVIPLLLLAAANAWALKPDSTATPAAVNNPSAETADQQMTLEDAAYQVQQLTGGRILSADPQRNDDGNLFYRFKVLDPEGIVKIFTVDPENQGEFIQDR